MAFCAHVFGHYHRDVFVSKIFDHCKIWPSSMLVNALSLEFLESRHSLDEAASQQVASQARMRTMTLTPGSPAGKAHQIGFERTKI